MTETTKVVDVLLPLGRKQLCCVYMSYALFTLHTLLNAFICCLQLNTHGRHGSYPGGGLLIIDVPSERYMYIDVMPNRSNNEHVLIISCIVMHLHFVNCPAVICLPNIFICFIERHQ